MVSPEGPNGMCVRPACPYGSTRAQEPLAGVVRADEGDR